MRVCSLSQAKITEIAVVSCAQRDCFGHRRGIVALITYIIGMKVCEDSERPVYAAAWSESRSGLGRQTPPTSRRQAAMDLVRR